MSVSNAKAFNTSPTCSVGSRLSDETPLAITMWDFSWLERRWSGAGYENWDIALDELAERGYNAVRIDAYPHLCSHSKLDTWQLQPCWDCHDWGSPAPISISPRNALVEFIAKCREKNIKVLLSSWYQKDQSQQNLYIPSPETHAEQWLKTVQSIHDAGLLDAIIGVDFCNEWPFDVWAPYYSGQRKWDSEDSLNWMQLCIAHFKSQFPELPCTFSFAGWHIGPRGADVKDLQHLDFLEPHVWMVHGNHDQFYKTIGYEYQRWGLTSYNEVIPKAENLYRSNPEYWHDLLKESIHWYAEQSREANRGLMTTECWSIVDYKDYPTLDWGWVKESCAEGVRLASETGRWIAMGTSNFCGPQFKGMWDDIQWHQNMTNIIKNGHYPTGT